MKLIFFVQFSLEHIRWKCFTGDVAKQILKQCDIVRDEQLPSLGARLEDKDAGECGGISRRIASLTKSNSFQLTLESPRSF